VVVRPASLSETPPASASDRTGPLRLQVSADRLLQDWKAAHDRAHAYLAALGLARGEKARIADTAVARAVERPWEPGGDAIHETLRAVRELVREGVDSRVESFLAWRIARIDAGIEAVRQDDEVVCATPAITRRSMIHEPVERSLVARLIGRRARRERSRVRTLAGRPLRERRKALPWVRAARRRRALLGFLVLVPTVIASGFMVNVLPYQGRTVLELAIVLFFGALFGWISIGFWTAMLGFWVLVRGRDRFAITSADPARIDGETPPAADDIPATDPDTAIIMPICAEPVERVFAGLRVMWASLERAGAPDRFHVYVLSDTADPGLAVAEEEAWLEWCREVNGFGRIFYRRRKARIARKSGNVADFCRRFGRRYRYMITLDADSVMAGRSIARLAELMDQHPTVGMIQTVPTAVNRRSLLARITQFSSRVYGPMFAAGLHWWQLGDGQYWGHNTIVRVKPFMDHCGLPKLPGREPLGGEILSHDFVEAALMGRAGWGIWLGYDLGGSWEEVPSTLLEEMKRDRRWCQGNLQHLRLLFTEGLFGAHRMLFLNGALSYVSALLWFFFLVLSTVEAIMRVLAEPDYFPHGPSLFPEWPIWRPDWAIALMGVIGMILFLPKVLAIGMLAFRRGGARGYGGVARLAASVALEVVTSSLLAPIRMVFHSRYVLLNLLGRTVGWKSQGRDDAETSWREAFRHHAADSLFASAWGGALFWLNPDFFWWTTPIIGALLLSIPVSVVTSRVWLGDLTRRWGLFRIPEEVEPPLELRDLQAFHEAGLAKTRALPPAERHGFARAVVDPFINALHRALLGRRRSFRAEIRAHRAALVARALAEGPRALSDREQRILLQDPDSVDALHERVWALGDANAVARWGRPAGKAAMPAA
jgi:membrane glycosyltransferase